MLLKYPAETGLEIPAANLCGRATARTVMQIAVVVFERENGYCGRVRRFGSRKMRPWTVDFDFLSGN